MLALFDRDRDGRAEETEVVASSGIESINGITMRDQRVYLAPPRQVLVADRAADGLLGKLPDSANRHRLRHRHRLEGPCRML